METMGNMCGVEANGSRNDSADEEFKSLPIDDLLDSDQMVARDALLSEPPNGMNNISSQGVEVKEEIRVAIGPTPSPRPLWISFDKTDGSKSVEMDGVNSFQVRKDASLKLRLETDENIAVRKMILWITYKNPSYQLPVEVQDPEQRSGGLESLAVFRQAPGSKGAPIVWEKNADGTIMATVENSTDLFISFRAVSSEVKKGQGWIFHAALINYQGKVVATGSVNVKSLKIIRINDLKRKRQPSYSSMMTPSPSSSEASEDGDDMDEIPSKSPKQLLDLLEKERADFGKVKEKHEAKMKRIIQQLQANVNA